MIRPRRHHEHLAADDDEIDGPSRRRRRPGTPLGAVPLAIFLMVAAMAIGVIAGFRPALSDWSFLGAGVLGALAATALAVVARARRLLLGESVAASAVAFVVLGSVAAGGVPRLAAYEDFFDGLVNGWATLLSSPAPTDVTPELRVLPYTIAWLSAAIGAEIARHVRRPGLPAIGPVLGLGLTLALTVFDRRLALTQGAGIFAGTLALVGLGQRAAPRHLARTHDDGGRLAGRTVAGHRTRLALGALVVIGAITAAPWLGPRLPLADANERFDLRRYQVPPFDPLALPSPLVQVKANLKAPRRDEPVFTITGPPVTLLPVAVMTDYDGVVWTVGDPERNRTQAAFSPVDSQLPALERTVAPTAPVVTHHVEVAAQRGYFLPTAGSPTALTIEGADADPYLNLETGTIALRQGLPEGLRYEVTSAVPPAVTDEELATASIVPVDRTDELELLPPTVRNLAADLTQGRDRGWDQMAAIRDRFAGDLGDESAGGGYYDVSEQTPPGHSYGRIEQMLADPDRIVGFEEQYAAAAAVLGRVVGLPARVVVGYQVPAGEWTNATEPLEVPASWISAWVEIDAGARGWVPVLVTPDRDREPDPETESTTEVPVAIPSPPPPPPPPPDIQPPRQDDEDPATEKEFEPVGHEFGDAGPDVATLVAVGVATTPLILALVFALIVLAWKALRRRRRRRRATPAGRVAGAWAEALDRAVEAGAPVHVRTTPREAVQSYARDQPELAPVVPDLAALARQLDQAVYAPEPPDTDHVERAWTSSDRVAESLRAGRSLPRRVKMRIDPRPLRRETTTTGARRWWDPLESTCRHASLSIL